VKNWEIIADNVKKAGWNLGWVSGWILTGEQSLWLMQHRQKVEKIICECFLGINKSFWNIGPILSLYARTMFWTIYAQLKPSGDYRRTHAVV
jgi:hypothetical protein